MYTDKTMKVIMMHNVLAEEDPSDVFLNKAMEGRGSRTKARVLLMGLIDAFNLEYSKQLMNTLEVFQKLFLELDGAKLMKKVYSLKRKHMQQTYISSLVPRGWGCDGTVIYSINAAGLQIWSVTVV